MEWWHWLLIGLVLVALEMAAAGGFFVIFFGIAALAIGGLHLFDLAGPLWWQLALFSILSVASLLLFRGKVLRLLQPDAAGVDADQLVGDIAWPLEDISPGTVGRAELRGSVWKARNSSAVTLNRAQRCTVVAVDRLMIILAPEGAHR